MQNLSTHLIISPQLAEFSIDLLGSAKWCSEKEPSGLRLSSLMETIPQGQGDFALRNTIAQLTEQNFHLMSPHFLRQLDNTNLQLRLILQCKRIGHILGFIGEIPLPDGTKLPFESFNETFVFPMLRSSFALFSGKQKQFLYPSSEINQPVLENCGNINGDKLQQDMHQIFSHALWHDNMDDKRLNEVHSQIHDSTYNFPILIGTGYDWHSTQLIFYKDSEEDYFIYSNRGNDCGNFPGWVMCRIGDKKAITIDWLKKLIKRLNATPDNYTSLKRITSDLKASSIFYCPMEKQPCGNCTYTSLEAAILALLTLWIASKQFTRGIFHSNHELLSKSLLKSKKIYSQFINFDCHIVLADFLIDLKKINLKFSNNVSEDIIDGRETIICVASKIFAGMYSTSLRTRIGWPLWSELASEILTLNSNGIQLSEFNLYRLTVRISSVVQLAALFSQISTAEELFEMGVKFAKENTNNQPCIEDYLIEDFFNSILSFEAYEVAAKLIKYFLIIEQRQIVRRVLIDKIPPEVRFKIAKKIINSNDLSSDDKEEFMGVLFNGLTPIEYVEKFIDLANVVENQSNHLSIIQMLSIKLQNNFEGFYSTKEISYRALQVAEQELKFGNGNFNLKEWNQWSSSRNTLILWDRVAAVLELTKPSFDKKNSLSEFIQTANRFPEWLQINEADLSRLLILHLTDTNLTSLPKEIGQFTSLKTLVIKNNPIYSFPKEFSNLTNLRNLTCSMTRMSVLPKEICSLINLEELSLSYSPLNSLQKEIVNLTKLESLGLEGCKLVGDSADLWVLRNSGVKVWT